MSIIEWVANNCMVRSLLSFFFHSSNNFTVELVSSFWSDFFNSSTHSWISGSDLYQFFHPIDLLIFWWPLNLSVLAVTRFCAWSDDRWIWMEVQRIFDLYWSFTTQRCSSRSWYILLLICCHTKCFHHTNYYLLMSIFGISIYLYYVFYILRFVVWDSQFQIKFH